MYNRFSKERVSNSSFVLTRTLFVNSVTVFLFACLFLIATMAKGQTIYGPLTISGVTTNTGGKGSVISIVGNASLSSAQTWQDGEGYHIVIPNAIAKDSVRSGKGVKVSRVGTSVEFLVQAEPGADVDVERAGNRLNISIQGKLQSRPDVNESPANHASQSSYYTPSDNLQPPSQNPNSLPYQPSFSPRNAGNTGLPTAGKNGFEDPTVSASPGAEYGNAEEVTSDGQPKITGDEGGLLATVFSGTSLLIVMALGLFGLLMTRKLHSHDQGETQINADKELEEDDPGLSDQLPSDANTSLAIIGESRSGGSDSRKRKGVVRLPVSTPASLYGAYRIDQEVGKLILGQAHRMDVLSSRASDDRRAIETSLMKTIASPHSDETGRRRAREALEEYGFVARHCASLLMSPDAFERTSAARTLGEIQSAAALPFLLEGLYDTESIVRNQAVVSIGQLKIPAAIGALLDMARRHPDVPSSLVSKALSACSVEGLDFFDAMTPGSALLLDGETNNLKHDITHLEPATAVEDLPESSPDEVFAETLAKAESQDVTERTQAVKDLAQFHIQSSVSMLSTIACCDLEPPLRALAIAGLASINHESVFPAILIGMADESREVRAAAARALSRLEFDRADAYVRVIETADDDLLKQVASACIRSGIVAQNIDRLASNDRRQAYESYSLICLLAKAGMIEPVIEAVHSHQKIEVRLMAIQLLATAANAEVIDRYRQLAVDESLPEDVKTALLESIYKFDQQSQPAEEEYAPGVVWFSAEGEPEELGNRNQQSDQISGVEEPGPELELPSQALFEEREL
jgi:HEAT repeat protein